MRNPYRSDTVMTMTHTETKPARLMVPGAHGNTYQAGSPPRRCILPPRPATTATTGSAGATAPSTPAGAASAPPQRRRWTPTATTPTAPAATTATAGRASDPARPVALRPPWRDRGPADPLGASRPSRPRQRDELPGHRRRRGLFARPRAARHRPPLTVGVGASGGSSGAGMSASTSSGGRVSRRGPEPCQQPGPARHGHGGCRPARSGAARRSGLWCRGSRR